MQKSKSLDSNIKYGDVYSLGTHKLLVGDCRDPKLMEVFLKDQTIKSINVDVPYGINLSASKKELGKNLKVDADILNDQYQSPDEYIQFTRDWLKLVKPYLATKNSFYAFNCDKMVFALRDAFVSEGFTVSQLLVWLKDRAVIGRKDYLPQTELIMHGWFKTHEFLKSKDKNVIVYPKPSVSPLHCSQKPVGLIRRLILNSTRIGDTVFDGFAGSGTCVIACEDTQRKCLAVELSLTYCQTILDRFRKHTGIEPIKLKERSRYGN